MAAAEPRRTGDHSTGTHRAVGQHLRRVRHGKRFIAQRTASSGCGHRASKQEAWERKPSVRERREDPGFQQVWQQRALDRDRYTRPDLSQLQPAHSCPGQEWEMRTALLNTLGWLQREEVPVDGDCSQTPRGNASSSTERGSTHSIVGQRPRMAPCLKADSFRDCPLASNTYIQHFNFSSPTLAYT